MEGHIEIVEHSPNQINVWWIHRVYKIKLEIWTTDRTLILDGTPTLIQRIKKVKFWRTPSSKSVLKLGKINMEDLMKIAIGNPDGFDSLIKAIRGLGLE